MKLLTQYLIFKRYFPKKFLAGQKLGFEMKKNITFIPACLKAVC